MEEEHVNTLETGVILPAEPVERSMADCNLKFDPGPCTGYAPMFYFNPATKFCYKFK